MPREGEMERVLLAALSSGGDFAEIFLEDREDFSIPCVQSQVRGITSLRIHGAGIRVLSGSRSVYVFTNDSSFGALMRLAEKAAELSSNAPAMLPDRLVFSTRHYPSPTPVVIPPKSVDSRRKIQVIKEMDEAARETGCVRNLGVNYFDSCQRVTVINSEGLFAEDERTRTRIRLDATVEHGAGSLFEFNDFVGPCGFELFDGDYIGFAKGRILAMVARLEARPVRSCVVPVVIEGGSGGVLWHEACGHPLESDNVITGQGEFSGKLGRKVASEKVTLVDDGSIGGMYGSEAMDDEGHPTQRNVLIDRGILIGYLCDRKGARALGLERTGSGRRQSYCFEPTSRMHNTYLAPGEDDEDEMIRSMGEGLFVKELGGGNGGVEFSIEVKEAFWVKNGEISHQVKGITLSGNAMDIIKRVDRVGKRLVPEDGGSFCGGPSGLVPTTAFQPRVRISEMSVSGVSE